MRTRASNLIPFLLLALFPACSGKTTDGANQPSENGGADESGGAAGSSAGTAGNGGLGGSGQGGYAGGDGGSAPGGSGGATGGTGGGTGGVTNRPPANHRATATPCDDSRPTNDPGAPPLQDGGVYGGYIECRTHAECTAGANGRCVGNGHDGWHCTYDACFTDSDCPAPAGPASGPVVCACENGFRSDNNVCIQGNCQVDADCDAKGLHWCSPTLGSCGNYTGFQGYYCHTPEDQCLDDADCSANGGYCAYEPTVGHWACSTQQCVG